MALEYFRAQILSAGFGITPREANADVIRPTLAINGNCLQRVSCSVMACKKWSRPACMTHMDTRADGRARLRRSKHVPLQTALVAEAPPARDGWQTAPGEGRWHLHERNERKVCVGFQSRAPSVHSQGWEVEGGACVREPLSASQENTLPPVCNAGSLSRARFEATASNVVTATLVLEYNS